jgi:hypothetical protein
VKRSIGPALHFQAHLLDHQSLKPALQIFALGGPASRLDRLSESPFHDVIGFNGIQARMPSSDGAQIGYKRRDVVSVREFAGVTQRQSCPRRKRKSASTIERNTARPRMVPSNKWTATPGMGAG